MFPQGVITREITVGPASDLLTGALHGIRVLVTPSRPLVWGGSPVLPSLKTFTFPPGEVGTITLPVTDQSGYQDPAGGTITLDTGQSAFYYKISVFYLRGASIASKKPEVRVLIPAGTTPIDIDALVPYTPSAAAGVISVPDSWSQAVAASEAAAEASAASAAEVAEAVADMDILIKAEVVDYLTAHPVSAGAEYLFNSPLATWTIPHTLGRKPSVSVFVGGEEVLTDVSASPTQVTITFSTPQVGTATLI